MYKSLAVYFNTVLLSFSSKHTFIMFFTSENLLGLPEQILLVPYYTGETIKAKGR